MGLRFENPLRLIRELGPGPWAVLSVLINSQDLGRVSQKYIETWTGLTDKTVSKALYYLAEIGLVNHARSGWMLIKDDSAQLPLPLALESGPGSAAHDLDPRESEKFSDSSSSSINLTNNDLNSTYLLNSDQVGKIPTQVQIRMVLEAAAELFGHRIMGDLIDYSDLDRLLAWICQAWDTHGTGRGRVQNPAALVYWAFHKGRDHDPAPKYLDLDHADQWLPESFMRKCGQWIFEDQELENAKIPDSSI